MKLNSRTNRLKLVMGGLAVCIGFLAFVATRFHRRTELVWSVLSTTQTNGAWLAQMEFENIGTRDALITDWNLTRLSKIKIPDDQAFSDVNVGGPFLKRIAPGERIQIQATMDSKIDRWWLHTMAVDLDSQAKLALWLEGKGWVNSLPEFLQSFLESRMQGRQVVVNGGPFTNSVNASKKR